MTRKSNDSAMAQVTTCLSYCRVCQASCGLLVDIKNGQVIDVRGDPDNPLTRGYICSKGRESPAIHHGENRLQHSQMRRPDGSFAAIETDQALDEIAEKLNSILREDGPDSVALFLGTYVLFGALTSPMARGWLNAIGSKSLYTTGTIDQSAKWIVPLRMGRWLGGWQNFDEADVWLLSGTNPLVSMQGGNTLTGFPAYDPVRRLREAKARGLKLIVIDPRLTETARHADIHLQPRPGQDIAIFACFIHIILQERLFDADFCQRYVDNLDALRDAVATFTPTTVAERAGLKADDLMQAARLFAQSKSGMAHGGTGPDMGPYSNLTEHLIATLNVICGRYSRAGDRVANPGVLKKRVKRQETVAAPSRHWEDANGTRAGGYGALWGERPTTALPDEILQPGPGRIRALIVVGANPAACWPDYARTMQSLAALDLLVVIDPRLTETGRSADYVIAPTLPFERPDHTKWYEPLFPVPYAQYTPALIEPPAGTIDDWRFFYRLGQRMGLSIPFGDAMLDTKAPEPEADALLRLYGSDGEVSYDDVLAAPHGRIFDVRQTVSPGEGDSGKFVLLPEDILTELAAAAKQSAPDADYPLKLICRRARWVMNSYDGRWASAQHNLGQPTAWVNPADLSDLALEDGTTAIIESKNGRLTAILRADKTLRPGVISMPHCQEGASIGRLVDSSHRELINAMPLMSAIPVRLRAQQTTVTNEIVSRNANC